MRHELRYGSFTRVLLLREGVAEADVKANYMNGILEIRIPAPDAEPGGAPTPPPFGPTVTTAGSGSDSPEPSSAVAPEF